MSTNIQEYNFGYKEKEATPKARKFAFDFCEKAGNLCALTFALTNDAKQTPDWYETQLISLVTGVYVTLAQCSELLNLNIIDGVKEKMKLNAKKYNEEQCKNREHIEKYVSATTDNRILVDEGAIMTDFLCFNTEHWSTSPSEISNVMEGWLKESLWFVRARGWKNFDTPQNLALAVFGEVGEFAENLQWKHDTTKGNSSIGGVELHKLLLEMADISIYLVRLANTLRIVDAVRDKLLLM